MRDINTGNEITLRDVGLSGIAVLPDRMRKLDPEKVAALAELMKAQGQLSPIILYARIKGDTGYFLVAGWHRLEAARKLKWEAIRAEIHEGWYADQAELCEIDENLIRSELSPAERVLHIGKRRELYERLHPETKHGAIGRGRKKSSQVENSFAVETAKKTGKGRSTIARDAQRAKDCAVLKDIVGTSLDQAVEIDALITLPAEEQQKLAKAAASGEAVSARTRTKQVTRDKRQKELAATVTALPTDEWKWEPWTPDSMPNISAISAGEIAEKLTPIADRLQALAMQAPISEASVLELVAELRQAIDGWRG